ncbi:hypothetical protein ACWEN3_46875, partial [Streptomyces sp. NPDC004561]
LGDVRHITADSARLRAALGWKPRVGFAEDRVRLPRPLPAGGRGRRGGTAAAGGRCRDRRQDEHL